MSALLVFRDEWGAQLGATEPTAHGQWLSRATVHLLDNGRDVELANNLLFMDKHGVLHTVPAGFVSDGSSHPKITWSYFGGPLSGKYRRGALLHDGLLRQGMEPDRAHALFRDAMLADGLKEETVDEFFVAVSLKTLWDRLPILRQAVRIVRRIIRF